jgi:hypothetical protein
VGLDLSMTPVRLDSTAMRVMSESAEVFEEAQVHPPFRSSRFRDEPLPAVNRRLLALLPEDLDTPIDPFPRRSHGQAEYLLDPAGHRRIDSWRTRERRLPYRIVHGDRAMAEHMRAGQGIHWRCSTASFLAEAAARIDQLDVDAVRREFSVADMVEQGVYKVHPDEDDDESFAATLAELRRLGEYYHRLVDLGLDVVVVLD